MSVLYSRTLTLDDIHIRVCSGLVVGETSDGKGSYDFIEYSDTSANE